jgi:hypothetical protein
MEEEEESSSMNSLSSMKKIEEDEIDDCEKKIIEFNKANRQISNEVEVLKYKCNVVHEKHQQIRSQLVKNKRM